MPEVYTLAQAARLVGVSPKQFAHWLRDAGITTGTGKDKRAEYLTRDQLVMLALAHNRLLLDEMSLADLAGQVRDLAERVAHLEEQMRASRMPNAPSRPPTDVSQRADRPQIRNVAPHSGHLPEGWVLASQLGQQLSVPETTMLRFARQHGEKHGREWWIAPDAQEIARRRWGS